MDDAGTRAAPTIAIDALVLPGFSRRDAERVRAALAAELQRLVLKNGFPRGAGADALEPGADLQLEIRSGAGSLRPEVVGQQAARQIYERLR